MLSSSEFQALRDEARQFEMKLPACQKKTLGQYFTGMQLARLLAALAVDSGTRSVIDPMAGNGDLLDAVYEIACNNRVGLNRLDGIELDGLTADACRSRLGGMVGATDATSLHIQAGSAFDPERWGVMGPARYDLVITNPPYVRYQTTSCGNDDRALIRQKLLECVALLASGDEREILSALVRAYSGLADLSVPAWLLASALVAPGGRLALVVPGTWRTRDYADVIRYMLLRCYRLEYVIEDSQAKWFSDALVRTHLIVARKLSPKEIQVPVADGKSLGEAHWVRVAPAAADAESLVGGVFRCGDPEQEFADWLKGNVRRSAEGLSVRKFYLSDDWQELKNKLVPRGWLQELEPIACSMKSLGAELSKFPHELRGLVPTEQIAPSLVPLESIGVKIGQGLRTGCNRFFYVTESEAGGDGLARVKASSLFGGMEFRVPGSTLKPVIRRQAEIKELMSGRLPKGRVLDLRQWVLPEDMAIVESCKPTFVQAKAPLPSCMPDELAQYVRCAADIPLDGESGDKRIPLLSAVKVNRRNPDRGGVLPRFWYMLPDFSRRHSPDVFVPRINHGLPWVEVNADSGLLVDANFSTVWSEDGAWTQYGLKALLNSCWIQLQMERLGATLGGGALKLEATHLRQLRVPALSAQQRRTLHGLGNQLGQDPETILMRIDVVVLGALVTKKIPQERLRDWSQKVRGEAHAYVRQRRAFSANNASEYGACVD